MEYETYFRSREERRISRQTLTGKHGFTAQVSIENNAVQGEMFDFSSLGFAITLPADRAGAFRLGDEINVTLSPLLDQHYPISGIVIDKNHLRDQRVKLSAVMSHEQSSKHGHHRPVHLAPEQGLKGELIHPFLFKKTSYFEVESLSKAGFYLTNIAPDFTLFEGMELTFSLGTVRELQAMRGKVSNVSLTEDNQVRCFIEPTLLGVDAEREISKHCFHYAQKTPREIAQAGLDANFIKDIVHYRFVETQPEYEAVLKLRRKFLARRGLCSKDDPIVKFALEQDAYGRILIAFHNARVIGSALLVIGHGVQEPYELEESMSPQAFKDLGEYGEIMEITALCVERHYQDTDLLHGMFENIYREGLSAGKKHIIGAVDEEQSAKYLSMGFKDSGHRVVHPLDATVKKRVMVLDKETGITGKGMSPRSWWEVWGNASVYLYRRRIIEYSAMQRLRVLYNQLIVRLSGAKLHVD